MKRFLRHLFVTVASMLLVALLLFCVLFALLRPDKPKITSQSVLTVTLRGQVVERITAAPVALATNSADAVIDLAALKKVLKHAQADPRIQGIYLELGVLRAGWAQLAEIRAALQAFQQAGKFIIAYGTTYTQKAYYIAALADELVIHPAGEFSFQGFSQTIVFYKALLEKLGVQPEIFRVGKFKSAVEPFARQDMSPANKHQRTVLLNKLYAHFLGTVASDRQLGAALLRQYALDLAVVMPQAAQQAGLLSQVGYFIDVEALLRTILALEANKQINYVSWNKYALTLDAPLRSKQKIAVLTAEGVIVKGKGKTTQINTRT